MSVPDAPTPDPPERGSPPATSGRSADTFTSAYRQGFVRVAACTPQCEVGDPAFNAAETLALARGRGAQRAT